MEGGNINLMSKLLLRLWPVKTGDVAEELTAYNNQEWAKVTDENAKAEVSFALLKRIGDSKIGKGLFAQALADELTTDGAVKIFIPRYIVDAILWAVGWTDARA